MTPPPANAKIARPLVTDIEDVQGRADTRRLPINRVGIKDIRHPVRVKDRSAGEQHTIANFNMYVGLPHNFKGTHMSRFVEILHAEREISVESFRAMLGTMTERLEAETGRVEMTFPYFINKQAPVSGVKSLMDYEVTFTGNVLPGGVYQQTMKVVVPATSLCPCSKEISERGAHNQRSHITVTARTNTFVWIEDLVQMVEAQASCEVFGLLKRTDEKYVTERAYDNPKFVEDIIRDVAGVLNADTRIDAYVAEAENFESIHNHSAYALIEKDKTNA